MRLFFVTFFLATLSLAQSTRIGKYELSKACFNTPFDDFGVRKIAGKYYIISASVDSGNIVYKDQITGRPFTDVYELNGCSKIDAYLINNLVGQNFLLSSPQNDGCISGDKFGKIFFFSSNYFDSLGDKTGIFYLKRTDKGWSSPNFFPLNSKSYNLNHPCYDPYNKMLYFSSNMPGGKGGNDLYVIPFDGIKFGKIKPILEVNSPKDEIFPCLFDGVLYFSSDRVGGLGGLDIYSFYNKVTEALPIGVNTAYDDFDYYPLGEFTAFLASNQEDKGKNDEVYFVSHTNVPLHVLNIKEELEALIKINENVSVYKKLSLTPEIKQELLVLMDQSNELQQDLAQLESLNDKLNESIPKFLNKLIVENVHKSKQDYDEKDRTIQGLAIQFEIFSTTYDSNTFITAFEKMKSFIKELQPEYETMHTDIFNSTFTDGLKRIRMLNQLDRSIDQILEKNEMMYFTVLTEKSNNITEEQWQGLAKTQAGLTEQFAFLEDKRKVKELQSELIKQRRELDFMMNDFEAIVAKDKLNSFYSLDSLFNLFKSNPTQGNSAALMTALKDFNPILLQEISSLVESTNAKSEQLTNGNENLIAKQAKFDQKFEKEFVTFVEEIQKGETIGSKEKVNRMEKEYSLKLSSKTDSILAKHIFWADDVIAKFGSIGNILFNFDSFGLTRQAKSQLDSVLVLIQIPATSRVLINGYTDNIGQENYNIKLSKNRALSVSNFLVKKGIPKKNIVIYYHGEKFPAVDNLSEEGRKLNRRVELKLELN